MAAWQQLRADDGFASDIDSTLAAASAGTSPDAMAFRWPMTDQEFGDFRERSARAEAAAEDVRPLVQSRPDYTMIGIDSATGLAYVGITGDVPALQAQLDEALGAGRVAVVSMVRTDAELAQLAD